MAVRFKEVGDRIVAILIRKNKAYGNSALNPVRIFSKASAIEQLKVRIDDKLSRLARGTETDAVPEDILDDIAGYVFLLIIAEEDRRRLIERQVSHTIEES